MEKTPLYTIGHGTRKAEDFLVLLNRYSIKYLVDVRSVPYSRFNPQYRQAALKSFLEVNGITYVFMGDALGGRPKDKTCYNEKGRVDYSVISTKPFFRDRIERLKQACAGNISLAIMCSESKPSECHRTHLIANVLASEGIDVLHIDEKGNLLIHNLTDGTQGSLTLF
ncbi:hypothetical protein HYN59_17105 [Flavobacterium album]|uniref:DUF488 domain-containing protein n=1 Tax=Flavobacterium album TaxID=2175091 RepID=A0A2S1R211_9FLAO|nr:DUF488 domain-containing protein [Flavobacterium album]AWH86718.1 hypothetical protein HYN59_17105 [Flavobacterium album]